MSITRARPAKAAPGGHGTVRSMNTPTGAQPPDWMHTVPPGTFDRRTLNQTHHWITKQAQILRLSQMSVQHLRNVVTMLTTMAPALHLAALVYVILEDDPAALAIEQLVYQLTGTSLASTSPGDWIQTTPLLRAIKDELTRRDD